MANLSEQLKKMLAEIKAMWAKLEPKKQKLAMIIGGAVLALVVGITLFLNMGSVGYVVLYSGMESDEAAQVYAALRGFDPAVPARMNGRGEVEVAKKDKDRALAELALQGIPKSGLPYDIFPGTGSLTSTDLEKRKQIEYQLNNRLQDTISQFADVKKATVTISLVQGNNKAWETQTTKSTASVTLVLRPGVTFSKDNVTGIRLLVASSVGYTMDAKDVMVIDANTGVSLRGREDGESYSMETELERIGFQDTIDQRFAGKVADVISLIIDPSNFRVTASIQIDYDKVVQEIKEYQASPDGNNSGIKNHEIGSGIMGPGNLANGVPGEENNTDENSQYVDNNGDGVPDVVDYTFDTEYAVSYILKQIEQDQSKILTENSSVAVSIKGDIDEDSRQKIIELVSTATNIPQTKVMVHNFVLGDIGGDKPTQGFVLEGPVLYIIIGSVAVLLILLILVMIISSKSKKKKLAAALANAPKAGEGGMDMTLVSGMSDKQLEDRKRLIHDAAQRAKNDNAIAEEVRDFARQNPQITANLLRSWLKEDENL